MVESVKKICHFLSHRSNESLYSSRSNGGGVLCGLNALGAISKDGSHNQPIFRRSACEYSVSQRRVRCHG